MIDTCHPGPPALTAATLHTRSEDGLASSHACCTTAKGKTSWTWQKFKLTVLPFFIATAGDSWPCLSAALLRPKNNVSVLGGHSPPGPASWSNGSPWSGGRNANFGHSSWLSRALRPIPAVLAVWHYPEARSSSVRSSSPLLFNPFWLWRYYSLRSRAAQF